MTAATATPRVMRDRLLQAIDGQSNIRNMVVVVEVISSLEKYPVTKEVLEETRLGKLINDIRKKTKNEDLAKRAKKLLRNWQKLIDPGQGGLLSKELTGAPWSSKGSPHPCSSPPTATPALSKTGSELKARSDFNNCSPKPEQLSNRKRRCDNKDDQLLQTKKPKVAHDDTIQHSKQLPPNGLGGRFKIAANVHAHQPSDRDTSGYLDNNKPNKVPIHAVRPHPSASVFSKPPSTLMQRQVRQDKPATGGQHQPRTPRCLLQHPENPVQEGVIKKTQSSASPGVKVGTEDIPGLGESARSFSVQTDQSGSPNLEFRSRTSRTSLHDSRCEFVSLDDDIINDAGKKKREKYRAKDYVVNLDGPIGEDRSKPARLKDRRITFDPSTGQIKRTCPKASSEEQEVSELQLSEQLKPNQPIPPCPLQQTDWKELSRSEIIQSYLTQQSNILSSSGVHTPGAHLFMSEVCRRKRNAAETYILASDHRAKELPGISREISKEDLNRLQRQRWSGVNGCYDTKGNWYDWTECISLDPHGDESRLNILPYVSLD
ncbi:mediator of RNA polymerase II transcription subunit 26 [Anableps anableps]